MGRDALAGSMVSLWKYPKCPPNGDEEMEQTYERRSGQVKKYSACSESVVRRAVKREGEDEQDGRLRTHPEQVSHHTDSVEAHMRLCEL